MRFTTGLIASLATGAVAFPGMASMREELEENIIKRSPVAEAVADPEAQPLSALGGPIDALTGTVKGLLGSVATGTLSPDNLRPEPQFKFKAPGAGDSRGPCPGLNLLANYGYLPRNGYVNAGQILEATSRGFNMGQDLAAVLIVFAVLSDGSIKDEAWWLGTDPSTGVGGLNRHSTVESDISPNREDFYNGCGDNHHLSSRMFARNVKFAAQSSDKQFSIPVMAKHYAAQATFVEKHNPSLYYFPFPLIVSVVAYNFYPRFFSNGTSEAGGVANYESISSIIGAKYNEKTGQFKYVPERWPNNWYRRSFPYTAEQALLEGFTMVYPLKPVLPPGFLQVGKDGKIDTSQLLCELYYGLSSISPLALSGTEAEITAKIQWASNLLGDKLGSALAGCKRNQFSSNFLYPNKTAVGGPLNPGKAVAANAGNNVYGKVYFPTAPVKPQCKHSVIG